MTTDEPEQRLANMTHAIVTVNPATGERLATYNPMTLDEATRVAKDVKVAFEKWRKAPVAERAAHLVGLAKVLRNRKNEYARLMTSEMGKPITQSESEIEKCAWTAEFYAERGEILIRSESGGRHNLDFGHAIWSPFIIESLVKAKGWRLGKRYPRRAWNGWLDVYEKE